MKAIKTTVIKYKFSEIDGLDAIDCIVENYRAGQGQIIIKCFDKSWTHYWGAMGNCSLEQFFIESGDDYLANKLATVKQWEIDWDKVREDLIKAGEIYESTSIDDHSAPLYWQELEKVYGGAWEGSLPQKLSSDYEYLIRIIKAVKVGFATIAAMGR